MFRVHIMECGDAYAGPKCPLQAIVVHKKRNIRKINLFVRLSLILILLCPVLIYAWNSSFAIMEELAGINPEQLLRNRITEQVARAFADFEFDSVIDELQDNTGRTGVRFGEQGGIVRH